MLNPKLISYCKSDAQREIVRAVLEHGTNRKAAQALGKNRRGVDQALNRVKLYAASQGFAPQHDMTHTAPDGFHVKGTSTLYDKDGQVSIQWVKTDADRELQAELLRAMADELKEEVRGLAKPVKLPNHKFEDMLSSYVIGDAHFGMKAWRRETGEADFDLDIAEQELKAGISYLISGAPKSKQAMLIDVGDFMHVDNRKQVTPGSGNLMDVDTRYRKLCRVVVLTWRYAIAQLLCKHETVHVIVAPGNHNPDSAGWVADMLDMFYENEPRVTVDTNPGEFFYYRWGQNLFGVNHGDKCKLAQLPEVMAADRPKDWGNTLHRYWYTGHTHHNVRQEHRGCVVESFNTLAPGDAWHAAKGYRSRRQMSRVDFLREHGEFSRQPVNIGMLNIGDGR